MRQAFTRRLKAALSPRLHTIVLFTNRPPSHNAPAPCMDQASWNNKWIRSARKERKEERKTHSTHTTWLFPHILDFLCFPSWAIILAFCLLTQILLGVNFCIFIHFFYHCCWAPKIIWYYIHYCCTLWWPVGSLFLGLPPMGESGNKLLKHGYWTHSSVRWR